MTFWILMAGLFLLIYMKKPLAFSNVVSDYIFLIVYLIALILYVINTAFYNIIPQGLMLIIALVTILPLFIKFLSRSKIKL